MWSGVNVLRISPRIYFSFVINSFFMKYIISLFYNLISDYHDRLRDFWRKDNPDYKSH